MQGRNKGPQNALRTGAEGTKKWVGGYTGTGIWDLANSVPEPTGSGQTIYGLSTEIVRSEERRSTSHNTYICDAPCIQVCRKMYVV